MLKLETRFAVVIPSVSQDGISLDHQEEVNKAIRFFNGAFGGCTVIPNANGAYVMDDGTIAAENVSIVYSYGKHTEADGVIAYAKMLRKRCNQESVAIEIGNTMFLLDSTD